MNFCLFDLRLKPKSECLFDLWSIHHGFWHGLIYLIFLHYLKPKKIKTIIFINIIIATVHSIEEYLDNNTYSSLSTYIINRYNPNYIEKDNDTFINSFGDVLIGIIVCIFITIYWLNYNKIPYLYSYGLIPIVITCVLFDYFIKKNN